MTIMTMWHADHINLYLFQAHPETCDIKTTCRRRISLLDLFQNTTQGDFAERIFIKGIHNTKESHHDKSKFRMKALIF